MLQGKRDEAQGLGRAMVLFSLLFLSPFLTSAHFYFLFHGSGVSHLMRAIYGLEIMARTGIRDTGLLLSNGGSDGEARKRQLL
jgi:hypothetical protein